MRAVVMEDFGDPDVLRVVEIEAPEPDAGEVAIHVDYAGISFAEVKARARGGYGARPFHVPGFEVGGRVRAIGRGVEGLSLGQPVAAFLPGGGYAEVALAS